MQAKKRAAKKTYSAAKKGFPKKKITLEDLIALQAKTEAAHAKTEASIDRLSADLAESHVRMEARHAKTEAAIDRLSAAQAKTEASIDRLFESHAKTENALRKMIRSVDDLSRNLGVVTNRLGSVVEFIVVPKIREEEEKLDVEKPDSCRTW